MRLRGRRQPSLRPTPPRARRNQDARERQNDISVTNSRERVYNRIRAQVEISTPRALCLGCSGSESKFCCPGNMGTSVKSTPQSKEGPCLTRTDFPIPQRNLSFEVGDTCSYMAKELRTRCVHIASLHALRVSYHFDPTATVTLNGRRKTQNVGRH